MPITNANPASRFQRIQKDFSLSPQEEFRRDAILAQAYLQIVAAFDCRPDPRAAWDRTADGTEKRWTRLLAPVRMAVSAAVVMGDQEKIDATVEAARAFFRECEADIVSLVPSREEGSTVTLALDETHVEGPANEVEARFIAQPSPTTAEAAVQPLERQYERLGKLIAGCRRMARSRAQVVPLNGGVR